MKHDVVIRVEREPGADGQVALPNPATSGAAGADLRANLPVAQRADGMRLRAGGWLLIPTGLRFEIPTGFEVQIRPRSGLALHHGVTVLNAPGTIDSDYRGPVGVVLINLATADFVVQHGMRIAQAVVAPVMRAAFHEVSGQEMTELSTTARGAGGFGSTGVK